MEFNDYRTNEVLEPVAVQFYADRTRSTSPTTPVLSTNVCCDLEDILSDVSTLIIFFFGVRLTDTNSKHKTATLRFCFVAYTKLLTICSFLDSSTYCDLSNNPQFQSMKILL